MIASLRLAVTTDMAWRRAIHLALVMHHWRNYLNPAIRLLPERCP